MNENKDILKERMSSLATDSLKRIIEVEFNDYEGYALEMAKEELSTRKDYIEANESDSNDKFKNFMELLKAVKFELVESAIRVMYPEQLLFNEEYRDVYASLLQLEPNEENADYINIKNKDFHWNVTGEDANTGEKYGIEFYTWSDWLSFLVKDEQVYDIGKENFIAICLMTLTYQGFTEEEIQEKFLSMDKVDLYESANHESESKEHPFCGYKDITFDRALERVADIKQEFIEQTREEYNPLKVRPWIRYWARAIDTSIMWLFLRYTWLFIIPNIHALNSSYLGSYGLSVLDFLIWAVIEAYFISKWGCTPGKWVLNTKVQNVSGGNLSYQKALKRVLRILLYGEGLLIPFVSFVTNIVSYNRLMGKGITKWDEQEEVVVSHEEIEGEKVILAVIILVGIPIIWYLINKLIVSH